MIPSSSSLLSFLDAPVVVGDPDGKTVYVNPAFESRFHTSQAEVRGAPLAMLFEGGAREAVLESVAQVCERGSSVRFRVRERGVGFAALASPISVDGARVGVLLLLLQESLEEERLLAFHREIAEPVEAIARCLEDLFEQTGGRRAERFRSQIEAGMKALVRLRRWTDELHATVTGKPLAGGDGKRFDPIQAVRDAVASVASGAAEDRRGIELLLPGELPSVQGAADRFEAALVSLLRDRLQRAASPTLTLAAKLVGRGERAAVLISLSEPPIGESGGEALEVEQVPPLAAQLLSSLGASLHATDDPVLGRTTSIRLPVGA